MTAHTLILRARRWPFLLLFFPAFPSFLFVLKSAFDGTQPFDARLAWGLFAIILGLISAVGSWERCLVATSFSHRKDSRFITSFDRGFTGGWTSDVSSR